MSLVELENAFNSTNTKGSCSCGNKHTKSTQSSCC